MNVYSLCFNINVYISMTKLSDADAGGTDEI